MTPAATNAPESPADLATAAAEVLAERTGVATHDVAIVLGSGWRPDADVIGAGEAEVPMADLP